MVNYRGVVQWRFFLTPLGTAIWLGIGFVTAMAELALGTDLGFVLVVFACFILFPFTLAVFRRHDSMVTILVAVTFFKLLFVSQWIKIGLGQSADSFLDQPMLTMSALLLGMLGFTVSGLISGALSTHLPFRLMTPRHDPRFMLWLGISAMILGAAAEIVRHVLLLQAVAETVEQDTASSGGGAIIGYLSNLPILAVTILTARSFALSGRHKITNGFTLVAVLLCVGAGLLGNSRTTMLSGAVAFLLTYLSYGGRIRLWHMAAGIVGVMTVNSIIFPLIDLQRQLPKELPTGEYLERTMDLAVGLISGSTADSKLEEQLMRIYQSWDTRQYYGTPSGLLDRFSPSQVDEVASFVEDSGPVGMDVAMRPFSRIIPPSVLRMFGQEHPEMGGQLIQRDTSRAIIYTSPNYGIIAETLYYVGLGMLPLMVILYMTPFLFGIQAVYGGFKQNYLGTFATTLFLTIIADGQVSELYARLFEQGTLFTFLYVIAGAVWSLFAPSQPQGDATPVSTPRAD